MPEVWQDHSQMTEDQAKNIISQYGYPNVLEAFEALHVAYSVLGADAGLDEIYKWAESKGE